MASSFGQYTGGIQPVQGIAEAGANIASIQMRGWENVGKSLAEGIKSYADAKNEREMLINEIGTSVGGVKQLVDYAGLSGENKAFVDKESEGLTDIFDKASKANDMSLGALRGLRSAIKQQSDGFAQRFTMFNLGKTQNEQSQLNAIAEQTPKTKIGEELVNVHLGKFNAGIPYETQRENLRKQLTDQKDLSPEEINKFLTLFDNKVESGVKKLPPSQLNATILDQVNAARKIYGGADGGELQTDIDFLKSQIPLVEKSPISVQTLQEKIKEKQALLDNAQQALKTPAFAPPKAIDRGEIQKDIDFLKGQIPLVEKSPISVQTLQEKIKEKQALLANATSQATALVPEKLKPYFNATDAQTELSDVQEKIKQFNLKQAQGGTQITPLATTAVGSILNDLGEKLGYGAGGLETNEALRTYVQGIKANAGLKGQISKDSIESLVQDFYKKDKNALGFISTLNLVNEVAKGASLGSSSFLSFMQENGRGFVPLTTGEEQAIVDASRKIASKQQGYSPEDTIVKLKEREKQLKTNIAVQTKDEQLLKNVNETPAGTTAGTATAKSSVSEAPVIELGDETSSVMREQAISEADRKEAIKAMLTERLGYPDPTDPTGKRKITPSGFNAMWDKTFGSTIKPVSVRRSDGSLVEGTVDHKGDFKPFPQTKETTQKQVDFEKAVTFGTRLPNGKWIAKEAIDGTGIYLAGRGTFLNESDVAEFKLNSKSMALSINAIQQVQQIMKTKTLPSFRPPTKAEAENWRMQILQGLITATFPKIGSRPPAAETLKMFDDVIPKATDIATLNQSTEAAFNVILQKLYLNSKIQAGLHDITVKIPEQYDKAFPLTGENPLISEIRSNNLQGRYSSKK